MTSGTVSNEDVASTPWSRGEGWLSILRWIGPGMILVGSIVGSGELIATPLVGARTGYAFLWLILFSCIIKTFFQIEIGRYAMSTGKTSLEAFEDMSFQIPGTRVRVNWLGWLWLIMVTASILQQGAMVGGTAQALRMFAPGIAGDQTDTVYALIVTASVILLLLSGKYLIVERGTIALVGLFTLVTIYSVVHLQFTPYATTADDIITGFSFQFPTDPVERQKALGAALMAFGITGVGASELIAYPYWCLEKGYAHWVGPHNASSEWAQRARGWIGVMKADVLLSMVVFTVATVAFYLLAAAILHPEYIAHGTVPEKSHMIERLSLMYLNTFGDWSRGLFLLGAIAVLYSTFFVSTASHSRMMSDWVGLCGFYDRNSEEKRKFGVAVCCVVFPIIAVVAYLWTGEPVLLVMISGIAHPLMLPLLGGAILYLSYRRTDKRIRGGIIWYGILWIAQVLIVIASSYMLYNNIASRF